MEEELKGVSEAHSSLSDGARTDDMMEGWRKLEKRRETARDKKGTGTLIRQWGDGDDAVQSRRFLVGWWAGGLVGLVEEGKEHPRTQSRYDSIIVFLCL